MAKSIDYKAIFESNKSIKKVDIRDFKDYLNNILEDSLKNKEEFFESAMKYILNTDNSKNKNKYSVQSRLVKVLSEVGTSPESRKQYSDLSNFCHNQKLYMMEKYSDSFTGNLSGYLSTKMDLRKKGNSKIRSILNSYDGETKTKGDFGVRQSWINGFHSSNRRIKSIYDIFGKKIKR